MVRGSSFRVERGWKMVDAEVERGPSYLRTRGTPKKVKSVKRSQFPGVLCDVDWLEGQCVRSLSAPICHLASFCPEWLRLGGAGEDLAITGHGFWSSQWRVSRARGESGDSFRNS